MSLENRYYEFVEKDDFVPGPSLIIPYILSKKPLLLNCVLQIIFQKRLPGILAFITSVLFTCKSVCLFWSISLTLYFIFFFQIFLFFIIAAIFLPSPLPLHTDVR